MVDCEGFEPFFSCLERDIAKTIRKRGGSAFYFSKDTFNCVPISMANYLKSIAVFGENWSEIVCVINEKFNCVKLITPM